MTDQEIAELRALIEKRAWTHADDYRIRQLVPALLDLADEVDRAKDLVSDLEPVPLSAGEPDGMETEVIGTAKAWYDTAAQHHRNEQYYRGLVVQVGEMLGPEAYISDDGLVQQDVLCAKVPELVQSLLAREAKAREDERLALVAEVEARSKP